VNKEVNDTVFGNPAGVGVPTVFPTTLPPVAPEGQGTLLGMAALALNAGDRTQAAQLITYALQQQPNNLQAQFLQRVLQLQTRTSK